MKYFLVAVYAVYVVSIVLLSVVININSLSINGIVVENRIFYYVAESVISAMIVAIVSSMLIYSYFVAKKLVGMIK